MRKRRILGRPGSAYHVISRFVDRQFALGGEQAKRVFMAILQSQAAFSGVEILTFCLMGNHFHLLVRVPETPNIPEAEVLKRLGAIWSVKKLNKFKETLKNMRDTSAMGEELVAGKLDQQRKRMFDLSEFVKDVKQRFSIWFNHKNARKGTLFEERFKSVLVESGRALRMMAAYIELNPVRAGIVDDPVDYPWCGYAQAVGGDKARRAAIRHIMTDPRDHRKAQWRDVARRYRLFLFERGRETHHRDGRQKKEGFTRAESIAAWESGGKVPIPKLLRCKARYFTDSAVLGSRAFVETFIENSEHRLGTFPKAHGTSDAEDGLCSLLGLRGERFG